MGTPQSRQPHLLFLMVFLSISPVPGSLLGVNGNIFFVSLFCFFVLTKTYLISQFPYKLPVLIALALLCALPTALFWGELGIVFLPIYFLFSLVAFSLSSSDEVNSFCEISSIFLKVVLVGAWIGFFYALLGGESFFSLENPDGRENAFFLSTFSNFFVGSFIRPAGVFDEPGALSFIVCFISALRHKCGLSKKITWQLLLLGLITLSFAHFVYIFFHALQDRYYFLSKKKFLAYIAAPVFLVFILSPTFESSDAEIFFSRFVVTDGRLVGDSRTDLFTSALDRIDSKSFFFGTDADCIVRPKICESKGHEPFGETPAGIILMLGLFLSLPYFYILALLLFSLIFRRDLIALGLLLLLLQRPYVMAFGYSLLILLVVLHRPRSKLINSMPDNMLR